MYVAFTCRNSCVPLGISVISVLPKGRSFTANSGKAAIVPKGRSSIANSGTWVAVLLGMNRCGSFPLLSAPHSLFIIWTNLKRSEKIPGAPMRRWGEWIWLTGPSRLHQNSPQGLNISSIRVFDQIRDLEPSTKSPGCCRGAASDRILYILHGIWWYGRSPWMQLYKYAEIYWPGPL